MNNLLKETIEILAMHYKDLNDIKFCKFGRCKYGEGGGVDMCAYGHDQLSPAHFIELAEKTNYDADHGGARIDKTLVVVGQDWWLERHEYDGSEWWEYKTMPLDIDGETYDEEINSLLEQHNI